jgi:predicted helicase
MRLETMQHMLENNLGLITARQMDKSLTEPVFASNSLIDAHSITSAVSISYIFHLYLYPQYEEPNLFSFGNSAKRANISSTLIKKLQKYYARNLAPEEVMNYVYSILFSTFYQETYSDFLQFDFPRIPFTANYEVFDKLRTIGSDLMKIHLLNSQLLSQPKVKFLGQGQDYVIGRRSYDVSTNRVNVNKNYYFEDVEPEVWKYQIGGYQVMDKYLKDRKGRRMDDPRHYIHIATAIEKTIEIQEEIDAIYPEVEKDLIEF